MNKKETALHYFLGYDTPQGFVSRFDQLADPDGGWRCYVLKGGPGSGKSTILSKVARRLQELGRDIELIHCASDPHSLDGIICPSMKISVADGTLPHAIEPKYPGVFETTIDIMTCCDEDKLSPDRDEIIRLARAGSKSHEYCCRYLGAAAALAGDSCRIAADALDTQKLAGYCHRLAQRELKLKEKEGKESVRLLSAVTGEGVVSFIDSAKTLCDRIYLINDEYGAVSKTLLKYIRSAALSAGYDVISCYCPLNPFEKLEHVLLPETGAGFLTSNTFHDFGMSVEPYRIVNSLRFTDNDKLKESRKRLNFNRKASAQMLSQAALLLGDAKKAHDGLERYYRDATDFAMVEELTGDLMERLGIA